MQVVGRVGCLCAGLMLTGCVLRHLPADNAFRVRGQIGPPAEQVDCRLALFRSSDKKLLSEVLVQSRFEERFSIAPGTSKYYFTITCPGWKLHVTPLYELGDAKYFVSPLDIGTIQLVEDKLRQAPDDSAAAR